MVNVLKTQPAPKDIKSLLFRKARDWFLSRYHAKIHTRICENLRRDLFAEMTELGIDRLDIPTFRSKGIPGKVPGWKIPPFSIEILEKTERVVDNHLLIEKIGRDAFVSLATVTHEAVSRYRDGLRGIDGRSILPLVLVERPRPPNLYINSEAKPEQIEMDFQSQPNNPRASYAHNQMG